jgi:endonuclease/exonuclease/phosphatase family metal-dependent hydrolase
MQKDATTLRVLTVNIHKGYTLFNSRFMLHELRDAIREVKSDLVFLQEVTGKADASALHVEPVQYEFLADALWPEHAYGRNAVVSGRNFGNAVLSNFPIIYHRNHPISEGAGEPRGLLHCILDMGPDRDSLHVMCTHLGLKERHRQHQLAVMRTLVEKEVPPDAPLILAGDFNDWRSRADALLAPLDLREVFRHAEGHNARTFPARWPLLKLDRIYVRGMASDRPLFMPRQPWAQLSDHAPLAAEVQLREGA